jgi:hypothetical protein
MGVLPLQFLEGEDATTLGLTGRETFDILGLSDSIRPKQEVTVQATAEDGSVTFFKTISRMDFPVLAYGLPSGDRILPQRRHFADRFAEDDRRTKPAGSRRVIQLQVGYSRTNANQVM